MFRSATFKLTMWYIAIVMTICLTFSAVLYHVTTNELSWGLHRESDRISRQFPVFQNDPRVTSYNDYDASAHRILLRLIGVNIIVLIGTGFASYGLARRTLAPIEEAHEQQKRFTADVSHELRTPLTALKMESEVALMNAQNSKDALRATIESNLEEVSKIEVLINNLLRLTRLESETLQQEFTTLPVSEIISEATQQLSGMASAKSISVIDSESKDSWVLGDRDSLIQLLVILLDNAIKYSSAHSTVTLKSSVHNGHVEITVADKGIGIKRESLDHVFDRFYRAESSRNKTNAAGYGLGLSIAKMIVDIHNGTITIRSRPGHGTTVVVSLPVPAEKP